MNVSKHWAQVTAAGFFSVVLVACQPSTPPAPQATTTDSPQEVELAQELTQNPPQEVAVTAPVVADAKPAVSEPKPISTPKPAAQSEQYAQVISVNPVRQSIDNKEEVCRDVEVVYQVAAKDEHKITGAVIGAVVGGALGNQVGDGRGQDAARIAGAIAGAAAGRKIQENQQNKNTETRIERQCETVNNPTEKVVAYDIVYSYMGQTHNARVAQDPGEKIKLPVRSIEL